MSPVHRQFAWRLAIRASSLSATTKLVALILDTYMDAQGVAWPSRETLAVGASLSIRQVDRAITKLEAAGLLAVIRSKGGRSNRYFALMPNGDTQSPLNDDSQSPKQRPPVSPTATDSPLNGDSESPEAVRKPSAKPSPNPSAAEIVKQPHNWIPDLWRYTGCRATRGSHSASHVYDPLGTDRPPHDWRHDRPTPDEIRAALDSRGAR